MHEFLRVLGEEFTNSYDLKQFDAVHISHNPAILAVKGRVGTGITGKITEASMDVLVTTSRAETIPGLDLADLEFAITAHPAEPPKPADQAISETDPSELALEAASFTAQSPAERSAEDEALFDDVGADADEEFSLVAEDEITLAADESLSVEEIEPADAGENEELDLGRDEAALHREDAPLELEADAAVEPDLEAEDIDLEAELERELQPLEPAPDPIAVHDLETVELELTLQHEDLVKLTFEDSLKAALDRLGGKLLFDMRLDNVDNCQRVAAVRLGEGNEKQFALVIMPPSGGPVRVEPTTESDNPLAAIAESYDGLMSALKIAA